MTQTQSKLERVISPQSGGFSAEHARYVLSLGFSDEEQCRFEVLSRRVQDGVLTEDDKAELDEFIAVNTLLMVLHSKARTSLKNSPSAA